MASIPDSQVKRGIVVLNVFALLYREDRTREEKRTPWSHSKEYSKEYSKEREKKKKYKKNGRHLCTQSVSLEYCVTHVEKKKSPGDVLDCSSSVSVSVGFFCVDSVFHETTTTTVYYSTVLSSESPSPSCSCSCSCLGLHLSCPQFSSLTDCIHGSSFSFPLGFVDDHHGD